jgi:hypothetical protein
MNTYYAALVFGFFIAVVAIFQLALAVGVPWGNVAMAGKFPGRFPPAITPSGSGLSVPHLHSPHNKEIFR